MVELTLTVELMAQSVLELKQAVDNQLVNGLGATNSPSNNDVERQTAIKLPDFRTLNFKNN